MSFKVKDHYFKKAKAENYFARSIYKLQEIDKKFKLLKKGNQVLDLGYYPGSWAQYTGEKIGPNGLLIGVDLKEVNKKLLVEKNIKLFKMDFFGIENLSELSLERPVDIILSDMAPDTTGIKSVDQDRSLALVEQIFFILPKFLKRGGNLVVKVFDGHDAQVFLKKEKVRFEKFDFFRPKSTRTVSKEFFVIGRGFQG